MSRGDNLTGIPTTYKGIYWKDLIGRNVFIKLKSGFQYSGSISEVDDTGDNLLWIHMIDKFGKLVVFLPKEVVELVER